MEDDSCEKRLFDERETVHGLVQTLVCTRLPTPESEVDCEFLRAHSAITQILDRYLEQSHVLDPYLHELLDPIMQEIKHVMRERVEVARPVDHEVTFSPSCQVSCRPNPRLHKLFQLVYCLCKVRGYKTIVKLLPHDVRDFEPTLQLLQCQDRTDHCTWETRYVLLMWLSILCLVPFNLNTIDSSSSSANDTQDRTISIVSKIVTLCKDYLSDPGATQTVAAVCLSLLLSRPDMEYHDLVQFLMWANQELMTASKRNDRGSSQFKVTGIMLCLAHIAKHAPRKQHIGTSRIYFATIMQLAASFTEDNARLDRPSSSTLHRKLCVKLVQRLGLLYLRPKVRSWRYSRGLRSLELNLRQTGSNTVMSAPQSSLSEGNGEDDDDNDDTLEAVDELEQIVEVLLTGLRDKDTVVRWSAAKGIGRITGRLPYEYADDIVQSVLELFVATEDSGAWHGASLALAELARRGVLLPQRLPDAVECVANALKYEIRKGTYSIGANVRDAACYVCWSFARAYNPSLLLPWLKQVLAPAMLVNCVFDRELSCRRAASAAFQESVGRQGHTSFPNGIGLLTKADYFSVANLRQAYVDVSVFVAKYPEYRYALLENLIQYKIVHWDVQIRELAALALGKIGALDPFFAITSLFPHLYGSALAPDVDVFVRHGAVMAIAELLVCLAQLPVCIDGELQKKVKVLPIEIDRRRLFRGRGGEMIRTAVCHVIEVISSSRLSLGFAHVKRYLILLEECFVHPNESVQDAAIEAFGAFSAQYCSKVLARGTRAHVEYMKGLIPRYISSGIMLTSMEKDGSVEVLNPNVAARRGFLRAVGVAAKELVQPCLKEIFAAIFRSIALQGRADDEDPGSRVAAVLALVDLSCRPPTELDLNGMEDKIIHALVRSIHEDYQVDERGDVGSWVRKEAMLGTEKLLLGKCTHTQNYKFRLAGTVVQTKYGRGVIIEEMRHRKRKFEEVNEASELDPVCFVQFEKPALGYYYFSPAGIGLFHLKRLVEDGDLQRLERETSSIPDLAHRTNVDEYTRGYSMPFARRLSPGIVGTIFGALVKQLAEKLDYVRLTAGNVLFRLLHSTSPRVDGIPHRLRLENRILPATLTVNWSRAHDTFPLVVQMLDIPELLEDITAGIIISVGGLTESVVKASKNALFDWFRAHLQSKDFGLLRRFSFFLLTLFTRSHQNERVTIPLMKTIALLLEAKLLRFLFEQNQADNVDPTDFGGCLYTALRDELQNCVSIPKLSAAISVLTCLLPSDPETERKALRALALFLGHRFPSVRKLTAEKLYTRLILHDAIVSHEKVSVQSIAFAAWVLED
ncbi:hypothetical protein PsorP6_013592 [Peronosclerospora sorghi]|uniref:Uncharacterized protein n=1 Tax=Peronosclerospora sorghi TaxID=230839 RepID=A0ACC0VH39_9STRA|nr:hypothetical protein PsorP6_013592 [Peronosclerospora sorghi]